MNALGGGKDGLGRSQTLKRMLLPTKQATQASNFELKPLAKWHNLSMINPHYALI
jgi:hypothetical protein